MKGLSVALSGILLLQAAIPSKAETPPASGLKLVIVEGEAGINNIRARAGQDVVVRVEDSAGKPVPGANVVFSLPSQGPGGAFVNGSGTYTATTDQQGLATMRGIRPNGAAGKFQIHVNASSTGRTARGDVSQFNMIVPNAAKRGGSGKIIAILILTGAAAAGGAVTAFNRGGAKSNGTTPVTPVSVPISITPGTGVMGPPQ